MSKSIGILYLCTGPYKLFWKDFYESFESRFLLNTNKVYYVFTDEFTTIFDNYKNNKNIKFIKIDSMPWPLITLLRFKYFLSISEELMNHDYLMFSNANIICNEFIHEKEFLPNEIEKLSFCQHPGYIRTRKYNFPYERRKNSKAYIPYNYGKNYVIGAMFAGITEDFLAMCRVLNDRIEFDLKNNIIARWHDESHLNRYIIRKDYLKILSPSYCYPVGFDIPYEKRICGVSKKDKFDVEKFKGIEHKDIRAILILKKIIKKLKEEGSILFLRDIIFNKKIESI